MIIRTPIFVLFSILLFSCNPSDNNLSLEKLNIQLTARTQHYDGNKVVKELVFQFDKNHAFIENSNATWKCEEVKCVSDNCTDLEYTFQLTKGNAKTTGVAVNFLFNNWNTDNYVIMSAAVYNGNRFDVKKYSYPPFFKREDYKVDKPITITDVPRLNKYEGKSQLGLNTGDMATPGIGIWFPDTKKGIWIITEQTTGLGNSAFTLRE